MILDSPSFNERLFFPRPDFSEPGKSAVDAFAGDWHVRRHTPVPGAPVLLLFHGNGEVVSDYDDVAPLFAQAGFNLCVADFPGYGRSRGTPTLRRIISEARMVRDAVKPDVVMGRSLGSACTNELIGLGDEGRFILESGFVDVRALIRRRGIDVPADFVVDPSFDPLPKLRRGRGRLLVLHGAEDSLISATEARAAHAAAGMSDKQLVLIDGRGHNDVSFAREYWEALATLAR